VQPRFDERFSGVDAAGDAFADASLRAQGDEGALGSLR
jgi:hypothetical protein